MKHLYLATNWVCNARCQTCNIWKTKDKTMMSYKKLQRSLASNFFDDVKNVGLFGGEPTLHPDIVLIIQVLVSRFENAEISIVTNGNSPKMPTILLDIRNNLTKDLLVCVSIDGDEKYHEQRRGVKGIYKKAVDTVAMAETLFKKKPRISITVLPESIKQIDHIIKLAEEHKADISLRIAVSGSYFNGKTKGDWTKERIDKLEEYIEKIPELANPNFTKSIPEFLRTGKHKACRAPFNCYIVDPNLDTRVCHNLPPLCKLEDVPETWKTLGWLEVAEKAMKGTCFSKNCHVDGPFSTSYLGEKC